MINKIYNEPVSFEVGDIFPSRNFGDMLVVGNVSSRNVSVKFLNTGSIVENLQRGNVLRGNIHDPLARTVEGVGFLGEAYRKGESGKVSYDRWKKMIVRCYSENYHNTRESYKNCTVADEWHNYTEFKKWFDENYIEGYHLDKDLLVQGNRVYSKTTCCFIPPELNTWIVEKHKGDCGMGVSKRRKKGSSEYNGLFNVSFGGRYLGRFEDQELAEDRYKEFKKLFFEEYADLLEERGKITQVQANALRNREV